MAESPGQGGGGEGPGGAPGADRILTVPNLISVVRLSLLPVFLWLLFGRQDRANAAVLLAALGVTDFLDGWIARRFRQVSTVGKVLDPVADRLLLVVAAVAILADGAVPLWFGAVVLVREALVSAGTLALAALGARRVEVTWLGKAGTFALMLAFPLFLAAGSDLPWREAAAPAAWAAGLVGLALSWWSAAAYVPLGLGALREARREGPTKGVRSAP